MRFGLLQRFGGLPGHPLDPEKGTTLCFTIWSTGIRAVPLFLTRSSTIRLR
jgi:hypothetical protein